MLSFSWKSVSEIHYYLGRSQILLISGLRNSNFLTKFGAFLMKQQLGQLFCSSNWNKVFYSSGRIQSDDYIVRNSFPDCPHLWLRFLEESFVGHKLRLLFNKAHAHPTHNLLLGYSHMIKKVFHDFFSNHAMLIHKLCRDD